MGDIVIFHPREGAVAKPKWYEDDVFIKRIVATAGDTVEARRPTAYAFQPCTLFELGFLPLFAVTQREKNTLYLPKTDSVLT